MSTSPVPAKANAAFEAAAAAYAAGRFAEGLRLAERQLKAQPMRVDVLSVAGACAAALGQFALAEKYLRRATLVRPGLPALHNNLGSLLQQSGQRAEALAAFRCALALQADYPQAWLNLARLLWEQGAHEEALAAYENLLRLDPAHAEALLACAQLQRQAGRHAQAHATLERALTVQPQEAGLLFEQALLCGDQGQTAAAEAAYRRLLALYPGHLNALCNLGNLLQAQGHHAQAETCYLAALEQAPEFALALFNLGRVLRLMERAHEAEQVYLILLAQQPDHLQGLNNLGLLLQETRRHAEAEGYLRRVVALAPDYAEGWNNLGTLLLDREQCAEALAYFERALALQPDYVEARFNLGVCHMGLRAYASAAAAFALALPQRPHEPRLLGMYDHVRRYLCDWTALDAGVATLLATLEQPQDPHATPLAPFMLLPMPQVTPQHQRTAAARYARMKYRTPPLALPPPAPSARKRIGYLSCDFHEHPTAWLLTGVLERHDAAAFEVHLYSYGPPSDGPARRRLMAACDGFHELASLDDLQAAQKIADDGLDMLVDLKGYTGYNRLEITALRPAPLIVSWLGYPGTLGDARLADFIIGDPQVTPPEAAGDFSERLALMPHSYQPTDRERVCDARPTRAQAGLPEQGFVFCSFNQSYKINLPIFDIWCRLLLKVPGSVLWLLAQEEKSSVNLRREAAARGVDPARLIFAPPVPQAAHLARLPLADLALDTWPCASHTTGSDALWCGVPLVARMGTTFASRVAGSLVTAAGLPELVTVNDAEYEALALALAQDAPRLANLRARLSSLRLQCPLFDSEAFARNLDALYIAILAAHGDGSRAPVQAG